MRGRLWIDKADGEMVKADAEVFEEVNVALGIAGHIDKGTRFQIQRSRIADGVWASTYEHARFSARVMVFKNFNAEVVNRTSGLRAPAEHHANCRRGIRELAPSRCNESPHPRVTPSEVMCPNREISSTWCGNTRAHSTPWTRSLSVPPPRASS
jgi:hypothetical protein